MQITITRNEAMIPSGRDMELTRGKKIVSIYYSDSLTTVCVQNAAHAAYRGCGRVFFGTRTLEQAAASYKDKGVIAMINRAAATLAAEVA